MLQLKLTCTMTTAAVNLVITGVGTFDMNVDEQDLVIFCCVHLDEDLQTY
jgi:hypothetical protein